MSENNINDCSGASDGESAEEEIEPKLKYVRISNDLQEVLQTETASCIAVHPKFVCLGTSWGAVHLFDHQGNGIECLALKKHSVAVNAISIDPNGDLVASCSTDGSVHVASLYSNDPCVTLNTGRHIRAVSLDPDACNNTKRCRFITGDDRLTLHERSYTVLGLARLKSQHLCDSEGGVGAVEWRGQFVAWSSEVGVRVYDLKSKRSLGLIRWEKPNNSTDNQEGGRLEEFRCNLRWSDERTLLIGWADTVRVCLIRKRGSVPLAPTLDTDPPEHQVDPVATFRIDFYISGIAPLDHQLIVLGVPKDRDAQGLSCRPQLHVIEYQDCEYTEVCTDSLSLRGYAKYSAVDYHLAVLSEENRFFVVAPKDMVVASPCDLDDRVSWLVQHCRFEAAMEAVEVVQPESDRLSTYSSVSNTPSTARRHTLLSVGTAYLDHLLATHAYDDAGRLCLRLFGRDASLWHAHVYKFARVWRLRSVSAYLPRTLGPHVYEMVLYEYLKTDAAGFLALVKEWRQPNLYNIAAVVNAVLDHLLVSDGDPQLMEAQAILYGYEGRYDKALGIYLKLQHTGVFEMIKENKLHGVVHSMIVDLMQLDETKAVELLLADRKQVPPAVVVEKLAESHQRHLYRYLDHLDKADPRECSAYHGLMVKLYSVFAREKLLPFLQRTDRYPIQETLDICQKQKYYPETVYLLGRIGDTKEALNLITTQLEDVRHAFAFCQEQNDAELWQDLVALSLDRPSFITYLLPRIARHVDPRVLVNRIQAGFVVPGLRDALVQMLRQCNLQSSIQEGCQKILVADYFALHERLVRGRMRGLLVGEELVCGACHRKLLTASCDKSRVSDLVTYNCRHAFHERCLPRPVQSVCAICSTAEGNSEG